MEFRDVGCVRIPFAINSKPFQPILIENLSNSIGIEPKSIYWHNPGTILVLFPLVEGPVSLNQRNGHQTVRLTELVSLL